MKEKLNLLSITEFCDMSKMNNCNVTWVAGNLSCLYHIHTFKQSYYMNSKQWTTDATNLRHAISVAENCEIYFVYEISIFIK